MTGSDTAGRSVVIWVTEGTWRASVDAALRLAPADAQFTLLHVTRRSCRRRRTAPTSDCSGAGGPDATQARASPN